MLRCDLLIASYTTLEEKEARHAQLLADLQDKYKGKAGKGRYYPPGTCPTGLLMQLLNSGATSVKKHQSAIEAMEKELLCVPRMVQPPLANNSHCLEFQPEMELPADPSVWPNHYIKQQSMKRDKIIKAIANEKALQLIAEEELEILRAVKPVSDQYMAEISDMVQEKAALRANIFEEHGVLLDEW